MAELPVRHRTLAPFGGITRIRFKGSSNWTSQPLRLPRIFFLGQNKTRICEVNMPGTPRVVRDAAALVTSTKTKTEQPLAAASASTTYNLAKRRIDRKFRSKDRLDY
jgi:hypothetical protein